MFSWGFYTSPYVPVDSRKACKAALLSRRKSKIGFHPASDSGVNTLFVSSALSDMRIYVACGPHESERILMVKPRGLIALRNSDIVFMMFAGLLVCWFAGLLVCWFAGLLVAAYRDWETDRKSTRLNSSHITRSRMPSSA